jgi:uncharacterized Fe-S cluster protein YjdI
MTEKTYTITNRQAIIDKIESIGGPKIDVSQSTGIARADGVSLHWMLSGDTVTINIVSKPWLVSEARIWEHIDSVFLQCL